MPIPPDTGQKSRLGQFLSQRHVKTAPLHTCRLSSAFLFELGLEYPESITEEITDPLLVGIERGEC